MEQRLETIVKILEKHNCLTSKEIANFAIRNYGERMTPAQVTGTLRPLCNKAKVATSKNDSGATVYWLRKEN